jgi:flagellar biogenesis protein FliO
MLTAIPLSIGSNEALLVVVVGDMWFVLLVTTCL